MEGNKADADLASQVEAVMGDLNLPFEARERVRTMPKQQQVRATRTLTTYAKGEGR